MTSHIYEDRLKAAAGKIGVELSELEREHLLRYLELLRRWNQTYNLTAVRAPEAQLVQHLFDSIAIARILDPIFKRNKTLNTAPPHTAPPHTAPSHISPTHATVSSAAPSHSIPSTFTVAQNSLSPSTNSGTDREIFWDVGSGAGLPGLPLAILWPQRELISVDSVGKKIAFQKHVIATLGLSNVTAVHGRIEHQRAVRKPELIVCRAFTSLSQFVQGCNALAGPHTTLAAMKGKLPLSEIEQLPSDWRVSSIVPIQVPELDAERHLILMNTN